MISRISCEHRQATAIWADLASASSRERTSMIENLPMTVLESGKGLSVTVPSVATTFERCTPPPNTQSPASWALRTTACDA